MKKLLFLNFFLVLLTILQSVSSCSPNKIEDEQKLENLDVFSSKQLLFSLSPEAQKQAWLTRLKMYRNLDFSIDQKEILEKIISDLLEMKKDKFFLSENLRNHAVSIAKITSQEDFINLFCEVTSSLPPLQSTGPICADYILNDLKADAGPNQNLNPQVTYRAVDCNCNWTCNQQSENCPAGGEILPACSGGGTTGCCNPTGGCGLFGLGTCNGYVVCNN